MAQPDRSGGRAGPAVNADVPLQEVAYRLPQIAQQPPQDDRHCKHEKQCEDTRGDLNVSHVNSRTGRGLARRAAFFIDGPPHQRREALIDTIPHAFDQLSAIAALLFDDHSVLRHVAVDPLLDKCQPVKFDPLLFAQQGDLEGGNFPYLGEIPSYRRRQIRPGEVGIAQEYSIAQVPEETIGMGRQRQIGCEKPVRGIRTLKMDRHITRAPYGDCGAADGDDEQEPKRQVEFRE